MGILNWWKQRSDLPSDAEINRALERLVPPISSPTDAELAEVWVRDGYNTNVRARHILFSLPAGATLAERERVRQQAEAIRARAAGGEDFGALARQYSADPRGKQGGDLGFFGRHRMVEAFECAAFALKPGQVSGVVETPFGYHVIKVEERREIPMGDKAAFRKFVMSHARDLAVSRFVNKLRVSASLEVQSGAENLARGLAKQPNKRLRGWGAKRALVRYRGGKLTVGQLASVFTRANSQQLAQITNASDAALREFLKHQASGNLIWIEARLAHWAPSLNFKVRWTFFNSGRIRSAPGSRLLWFADFFYSRKSVEEVLLPTVVDMRRDYNDALANGRDAKAKWVRLHGTWEFLSAALSLTLASVRDFALSVWRLLS
jgi:hypothetical protein